MVNQAMRKVNQPSVNNFGNDSEEAVESVFTEQWRCCGGRCEHSRWEFPRRDHPNTLAKAGDLLVETSGHVPSSCYWDSRQTCMQLGCSFVNFWWCSHTLRFLATCGFEKITTPLSVETRPCFLGNSGLITCLQLHDKQSLVQAFKSATFLEQLSNSSVCSQCLWTISDFIGVPIMCFCFCGSSDDMRSSCKNFQFRLQVHAADDQEGHMIQL